MAWIKFAGVRGKGRAAHADLPMQILAAFWQALRAIRRVTSEHRHRPGRLCRLSRGHDGLACSVSRW
jgi:hypothetical protein